MISGTSQASTMVEASLVDDSRPLATLQILLSVCLCICLFPFVFVFVFVFVFILYPCLSLVFLSLTVVFVFVFPHFSDNSSDLILYLPHCPHLYQV